MAWPTEAEIIAQFDKLAVQDESAITPFLDDAVARVMGVMAKKYDVSEWGASTPPMPKKWARQLTYAYFHLKSHVGSTADGGDNVAKTIRDQVEEEMKDLLEDGVLVDADGEPVPIAPAPGHPPASKQTVFLRTLEPTQTMGDSAYSRILLPRASTNMSTSRWR